MEDVSPLAKLVFRSYKPMDDNLGTLARIELQTESPWANWLEELKQEDAKLASMPIEGRATLVPRKPNWDIKRDAAKKLDKLERATQRAIAGFVKQKIASGAGQTPIHHVSGPAGRTGGQAPPTAASMHGAGAPDSFLEERLDGLDGAALSRAMQGGSTREHDEGVGKGEDEGGEGGHAAGSRARSYPEKASKQRARYDSDDEDG